MSDKHPQETLHLAALLRAPDSCLDLSGSSPFSPELTVTLHAPNAVLLHTPDTFLCPRTALHEGRISFTNLCDGRKLGMPTFDVHEDAAALSGASVWQTWWRWITKTRGNEERGVPVLPAEEQLRIHVLDGDVSFACVGEHMGPTVTRRRIRTVVNQNL